VAWALLWYAAGLVGHCVVEIVSRAFYALHDTKTPVLVGIVAMSLNLGFSLLFSALFSWLGWAPHGGLALANSLATALEMSGLLFLMRRKLGGLQGKHILEVVWKAALATLAMSLCLVFFLNRIGPHSYWIVALGGTALGGAVYALCIILLRVDEVHQLFGFLRTKILRQPK
jgi:putative peptidoglycan lipid II flippase